MADKPPGFDKFDALMRKLVKVPADAVTPTITIRCPRCKMEKVVDRHEIDPPGAVLCMMYCPDCCAGEGFKSAIVGYYDDTGNEVIGS